MSKIRLNVESLAVGSFATAEPAPGRGTVKAREANTEATGIPTCAREQTNHNSCYDYCECTDRFSLCVYDVPLPA